ncbi:hypothetical protein SAMN04515666_110169 [Bosea lupini]|uniref:Uncharacterized protein n=2 Tax=Bosea lupini TaxID=1036779 RepID=A0A1H7XTT4_9HYPH|nr:hypothetical protein SAMN04515666_110169 [Bosea lupini]
MRRKRNEIAAQQVLIHYLSVGINLLREHPVIEYATKHFLVISAIATILGAAMAALFAYGYLIVFGSGLVWILEYSDLLKLALIGVLFVLAYISIITVFAQEIPKIMNYNNKLLRNIVLILLILALLLIYILPEYKLFIDGDVWIKLRIIAVSSLIVFSMISLLMTIDITSRLIEGRFIALQMFISFGVSFMLVVFIFGVCRGLYVKTSKESFVEILARDKGNVETLYKNSKIIMMLSHHAIFQTSDSIIVIPASDVVRITAGSKGWSH